MDRKYIARVKYTNDLPPPKLPPKLLKYNADEQEFLKNEVNNPSLITTLSTKNDISQLVKINEDLGMELNLMKFPGVLDNNDDKMLYGFENIKLAPEDRVLLRNPGVDRLTKTDISKVGFLRRTEYTSSTLTSRPQSASANPFLNNPKHGRKRKLLDSNGNYTDQYGAENVDAEELEDLVRLDSKKLVTKIESTFQTLDANMDKYKHPVKKNLKAKKVWSFLPDTVSMDEKFFMVKLVGSAVLDKAEREKLSLDSAIFRPVELNEDDWMSFYSLTDKSKSKKLINEMEHVLQDKDTLNASDTFKFQRVRDYNMHHIQFHDQHDLAIAFNSEKNTAFYKPIQSRIELKKRRVNDFLKPLVKEHTVDQINVVFNNPTTEEQMFKDKVRSEFDPIDFPDVE